MASKKVSQVNLKGGLDLAEGTITEVTKDAEYTYDFMEILREFDGRQISVSLKEENELPVKE